jgi:hypothetical protein
LQAAKASPHKNKAVKRAWERRFMTIIVHQVG